MRTFQETINLTDERYACDDALRDRHTRGSDGSNQRAPGEWDTEFVMVRLSLSYTEALRVEAHSHSSVCANVQT